MNTPLTDRCYNIPGDLTEKIDRLHTLAAILEVERDEARADCRIKEAKAAAYGAEMEKYADLYAAQVSYAEGLVRALERIASSTPGEAMKICSICKMPSREPCDQERAAVETKTYPDGVTATGTAPLPDESPEAPSSGASR